MLKSVAELCQQHGISIKELAELIVGLSGFKGRLAWAARVPGLRTNTLATLMVLTLAAWILSGIYKVQPDEQGVVLRFGKWVATTGPGLPGRGCAFSAARPTSSPGRSPVPPPTCISRRARGGALPETCA